MIFVYHRDAGSEKISIEGEQFNHIFHSRRAKKSEHLECRNLLDDKRYFYGIENIKKNSAELSLLKSEELAPQMTKKLHIIMCVIEPKNIEKIVPFLNEIGVWRLSFVYCVRSQKSYKIDINRLEKIAISSSQQCGRNGKIEFGFFEDIDEVLSVSKNLAICDFSSKKLSELDNQIDTILIGCEGGFSEDERMRFSTYKIIGLKPNNILKAETVATYVASKLL